MFLAEDGPVIGNKGVIVLISPVLGFDESEAISEIVLLWYSLLFFLLGVIDTCVEMWL